MNAPKKSSLHDPLLVDAGIEHRSPNLTTDYSVSSLLFHPFDKEDAPGIFKTVGIAVLTFVGAMVNGFLYLLILIQAVKLINAVSSPSPADYFLYYILIASMAALFFYIVKLWTYESTLRHYVYPENAMAAVAAREIGLIVALVVAGILIGGYAAAGGITHAIVGTPEAELVNGAGAPLTTATKVLLWFGTTFVVFNYIYNIKFYNKDDTEESRMSTTRRASKVTAFAIAGTQLAYSFLGTKLISVSSGLYVAGVVANGRNANWPFLVFVPLFASSAAAVALYLLFTFFAYTEGKQYSKWKRSNAGTMEEMEPRTSTMAKLSSVSSSAARNRKPVLAEF